MLVRDDEIAGLFQSEERAMKAGVGDVNLERGNTLCHKEANEKRRSCLDTPFHSRTYLSQPPALTSYGGPRRGRECKSSREKQPHYHESTKTGKREKMPIGSSPSPLPAISQAG